VKAYAERMDEQLAGVEWESAVRRADPRLRGLVASYTGYVERTPAPLRRLEAATMRVPMIISLGPSMLVDGQRHCSFVAGPADVPTLTEHAGDQCGIEVSLTPLGARRLLGVPVAELAGRAVAFEELLGRHAATLTERLVRAADWEARFALLDRALLRRLQEARPLPAEIVQAWSLLHRSHGALGVDAIAREVGWSRRHLAARFREDIGLPPKTTARILRFERVTMLLRSGVCVSLADAAYECRYADQSHLNRDFRAFAGTTPTDYAARVMPAGRGVVA
jgi:AraC-like DNA-binding protein